MNDLFSIGYYPVIISQGIEIEVIEAIIFFISGFVVATIIILIIIWLNIQKREQRAKEFSARFKALSEALSSFKALSFQIVEHIKEIRRPYINQELEENQKQLLQAMGGLMYLFENLSVSMIPPTEEIALSALDGKKTALEDKAYQDSIKFRDDVRSLKQLVSQYGLDGLVSFKSSSTHEIKLN